MSKATVALIAAASAATGAACTALFLSSKKTPPSPPPPPAAVSPPSTVAVTSSLPPTPGGPRLPKQVQSPVDPSGFFQYGFPGPVNDLATRTALISSFDRRMRNPSWVVEHITPESLAIQSGDRKNSAFLDDEAIPELFRGKLTDYFRSGYDRGHQVPAADAKFSQEAMDGTFFLSNMCPQVGDGFNRDYWSHFEDFCRRLTKKYPSVRIVTGPLYLPRLHPDGKWRVSYEVVGSPPNIAVPTHFYKVIVAEDGKAGGQIAVGAFVLPNAVINNATPLKEFNVPLEIVERASGLEFLRKLEPSRRKELCKEVECSITVREFQKQVTGKR